jgi:hypothetical protein
MYKKIPVEPYQRRVMKNTHVQPMRMKQWPNTGQVTLKGAITYLDAAFARQIYHVKAKNPDKRKKKTNSGHK